MKPVVAIEFRLAIGWFFDLYISRAPPILEQKTHKSNISSKIILQ
jgi:hypothetical protein